MSNKKRIDTSTIVNELRGASLFFRKDETNTPEQVDALPTPKDLEPPPSVSMQPNEITQAPEPDETTVSRYHDTVTPRHHGTTSASAASRLKRDLFEPELIEKVVAEAKKIGTIAATYRFTQEEKSRLGMTVLNLLSGGVRVSENELVRIALNFLLDCLEEGISNYDDNPYSQVVKRIKPLKR